MSAYKLQGIDGLKRRKTKKEYSVQFKLDAFMSKTAGASYLETAEIRSQLEPMIKLAKSLKKHRNGILRWFISKMTNGLLEGVNSPVQASKRKARGYVGLIKPHRKRGVR